MGEFRLDTGLSLIIPIYNERAGLANLAERLDRVAAGFPAGFECLLVDDGSSDGSGELLDQLDRPWLRVLRHKRNRGYGAALKTGVGAAQQPWLAITDADETYPDHRLPELFARLKRENLDMLVGARTAPGARVPLIRRPAKWVLGQLAQRLSGRQIPDLNSGLRIMRAQTVRRFLPLLPDGFSFTTTITLAMLSSGGKVEYEPIEYYHRAGRSKIRPIYDTLNFLQLICRAVLWFNPLRVLMPLGLGLIGLAGLILLASWHWLAKPLDITFGIFCLTGVTTILLGLLADLVDQRLGPQAPASPCPPTGWLAGLRRQLWERPLRFFLALALGLWLAGALVAAGSWLWLGRPMDVTTAVFVLTGVLCLFVGLLADLIDKRTRYS